MRNLTDLQKIAVDLYKGQMSANYSTRDAEDVLRDSIAELINKNGRPNLNKFGENKYKVFAILEEVLEPVTQGYELPASIANIIRVVNVGWGDATEVTVDDPALFKVYKVSDGNADIRRQTVSGNRLYVATDVFAIKIYAELSDFLAGRIDWIALVNKVNASRANDVARKLASLFGTNENPIASESGSFDADTLAKLIERVEEEYSTSAVIYGKKSVLGKIQDVVQSEKSKEEFNAFGYYGQFRGTPILEMPTGSNDLVILPYSGSPIAIVVNEGSAIVKDTQDFGDRNDLQLELFLGYKMGLAVVDIRGAVYTLA